MNDADQYALAHAGETVVSYRGSTTNVLCGGVIIGSYDSFQSSSGIDRQDVLIEVKKAPHATVRARLTNQLATGVVALVVPTSSITGTICNSSPNDLKCGSQMGSPLPPSPAAVAIAEFAKKNVGRRVLNGDEYGTIFGYWLDGDDSWGNIIVVPDKSVQRLKAYPNDTDKGYFWLIPQPDPPVFINRPAPHEIKFVDGPAKVGKRSASRVVPDWPISCPDCKSPAVQLSLSVECSSPKCRRFKAGFADQERWGTALDLLGMPGIR